VGIRAGSDFREPQRPPRQVKLVPHRTAWIAEFQSLEETLSRSVPADLLVDIQHIGSTAIPQVPSKDVIDIQVTVRSLDSQRLVPALAAIGLFRRSEAWNVRDHVPSGWRGEEAEWDKLVFAPPTGVRPCNVHVRRAGAANASYALAFRDFLRAHEDAARYYGEFKMALASVLGTDEQAYGRLKNPVSDLIVAVAQGHRQSRGSAVIKLRGESCELDLRALERIYQLRGRRRGGNERESFGRSARD
jgi:GrpB-like predicted nucleotidyltransferase (UPF0157 family)